MVFYRIKHFIFFTLICMAPISICTSQCDSAILVNFGDSLFSASSSSSAVSNAKTNKIGNWAPESLDPDPFMQVNMPDTYKLQKIQVFAGDNGSVLEYTLLYSFDGNTWTNFSVSGVTKVFSGHSLSSISPDIHASYIRVKPMSCSTECAMDLEIYGCDCDDPSVVSADVTYLQPSNINENFVYLAYQSNQVLEFEYTSTGSDLSATAELDTNQTLPIEVLTGSSKAKVWVNSDLFPDLGTYLLQTEVKPCRGSQKTKDLIVHHEEPITGLEVTTEYGLYVPVGEPTEFKVLMTTGSNVEMEWMIDHNFTTCLDNYPGFVRNVTKTFTFSERRTYNMTVFARNGLTATYKILEIVAIKRITGFNVSTMPGLYSTLVSFDMHVENNLTTDDLLLMGDISLNVIYGNGLNATFDLNPFLSYIPHNGSKFSCKYTIQGEYNLSARVENPLGFQEFNFPFSIWDELNVTLASSSLASIGTPTDFKFLNPPNAGFRYTIDYGDGNTATTNDTIYYSDYNVSPWTFDYLMPGTYVITMTAWNPFYVNVQSYSIIAQHPLRSMSVYPELGDIPIRDGFVNFTFTMLEDKPSPTDVSCTFDYNEGIESNVNTEFSYSFPLFKTCTYLIIGIKNITFNCSNLVSEWSSKATLNVRDFDIIDYTVSFPPTVGMNMTLTGNVTEKQPFGIITSIPVGVTFTSVLYNMIYVPPGVSFTWDFGDGTNVITLTHPEVSITHVFQNRGVYNGKLTVDYKVDIVEVPFAIQMGVANFSANIYEESPGETFTFTAFGIQGSATYYFDLILTQATLSGTAGNPVSNSIIYPHRGQFLPSVLATNGSFTEFLYPPFHIGVDYHFEGINVTLPTSIELPPGTATFYFSVPNGADPVLDITCDFISGDRIDRSVHSSTKNLTEGDPIAYDYKYLTLGHHDFQLNCKNFAHTFTNTSVILVQNECFSINGIFDRQYSNKTTPMLVLTSKDIDLASRMLVYCPERGPHYAWHFYNVTEDGEIEYNYEPVVQPTGTVRFAKGTIPAGLYKVSHNVSLDTTWMQEYTFVRFEIPKPYAYIVKGSKIIASIESKTVLVNAYTESYDAQQGYGFNSELVFTWYCNRYNSSSIEDIDAQYTSNGGYQYYVDYEQGQTSDCTHLLTQTHSHTEGIQTLNVSSAAFMGYVVIVKVEKDDLFSFFAQLIQVADGNPPDVTILCTLNCLEKYAVTSPLNAEVHCEDCTNDILTYSWELRHFENGTWVSYNNFANIIDTATDQSFVTLKANVLEPGERYSLRVTVSSDQRMYPAYAVMDLLANFPPYNGTCYANPKTGNASTSSFSVICEDWQDEGISVKMSSTQDSTNEPLVYEYVAYVAEKGNVYKQVPLFRGSESTATELPLPVGVASMGYLIEIEIRIYDRYGDFATFRSAETYIEVRPDSAMVPADMNDVSALDTLFETFDYNYNITEAGGNSMSIVRLVGSTASIYHSAGLQVNESVTSTSDLFSGAVNVSDVVTNVPVEPVQDKLITKTREFTKLLLDSTKTIPTQTGEKSPMSAANARQVARGFASCVSNPIYVDDTAIENAAEGTKVLMENIYQVSQNKPFPCEEINNIDDTAEGVVEVIDLLLTKVVPPELDDLDAALTTDTILREIEDYEYYHHGHTRFANMDNTEKNAFASSMLALRTKHREEQSQKKVTAQKSVPKMEQAITDTLKAKSKIVNVGAGVNTIQTDKIQVSIQKEEKHDMANKTITRRDTGLVLDSDSINNLASESVELWVTEYKKDPFFYASGASTISSTAVSITTRDQNEVEVEIPKSITLKNNGVSYFSQYSASNISEGIDPMFYFVTDLKGSDAVMVYLKPDNVNPADFGDGDLYTAFASSGGYPESSSYQAKTQVTAANWTAEFGFKIFFPGKIFSAGRLYIGLKPNTVPDPTSSSGGNRKKRSTSSVFDPTTANFSLALATTGCRTFDETNQIWVDTGCEALDISTFNETVCRCSSPPGNTFATTFYVPPNTIDFHAVWAKFDPANAAVYGTIIGLFVVYFIIFPLLRRKDRHDIMRWGTRFLCDSERSDCYFYLIAVQTGLRRDAGTDSNVNFILGGEDCDSGVRLLSDGFGHGFPSGSYRTFLMGTKEGLGELTYFRVWHDNAGTLDRKSWYLHKVVVDDLQTGKRYAFVCDQWLALEQDDGMVERIIPVTTHEKLVSYDQLISQHARFNATENHLWLSMIIRPQRSNFSRVQRLTCAFALLFLTMITNAMFFRSKEEVTPNQVQIGVLRFSLSTIYISFISIFISTVPIFIVTFIFKKSREKEKKQKDKMELQNKEENNTTDRSDGSVNFYREERLPLPHWMVYVGWLILALSVVTSAFFLILYSMEWGKSKSEEWLSTFVFSFLESLFVVDPLNVLVMAVLIALLFRKPVDGECPNVDLEKIREAATTHKEDSSRVYLTFRMEVLAKSGPPNDVLLEAQRKLRQSEVAAQTVLRRLIVYAIFVFIIFSIGYINRDARSYNLRRSIDSQLYYSNKETFGFANVNDTYGFIYWIRHTLLPRYFPVADIRGQAISILDKQFFFDMSNARVGPALLRQLRMKESTCDYIVDSQHHCIDEYDRSEEDTANYCVGWRSYNSSCGTAFTNKAWKYTSADEVWAMPFEGRHHTYSGGGYMIQFENDFVSSSAIIDELVNQGWIDRKTRAVFLEFTLYNPNINIFFSGVYLVEYLESAGLTTWINLQVFRPYQSLGAIGTFALLCYLIYTVCLIVTIIRMCLKIRKEGCCGYFRCAWNFIDFVCSVLGIIAIVFWALRLSYANEALDKYYQSKTKFIPFQHIAFWDNAFVLVISVLVFIATIRILQILGYNRRMTQLIKVISGAASDLSGFAIVFGIIYFAYVASGYLLFGRNYTSYRSLFVAFGSLTNSIIGKNHLDILRGTGAGAVAEVYYFTYILIVILVLISMFAVILNMSISVVKQEVQGENVYGLTNVISDSLKDIFGLFFKVKSKEKPSTDLSATVSKYEVIQSRKPDFDSPNIVNLLQEIFVQYGTDSMQTGNQDEKPDITIDRSASGIDFSIDNADIRSISTYIPTTEEEKDFTMEERNTNKIQAYAVFL